MNYLKALLPLLILIVAIVSLNTQFGTIPPIGKFVDPESGFWANAEIDLPESNELSLEGFDGNASVYFDERRVPHIFAENE
ncbi:MAG: hypothetical protein RJQ34_10820, partial [Balneola sp.]